MADVGTDARNAASLARETAHEMVKVARKVDGLEADVGQLKTAVYGSNPPPAPVPVVKRITHSEGDIAELAGQVIAVKAINEAQNRKLEDLEGKVDLIHKAVTGFFENPKVRFVGKVVFGLAMAYAAAKGIKVLP